MIKKILNSHLEYEKHIFSNSSFEGMYSKRPHRNYRYNHDDGEGFPNPTRLSDLTGETVVRMSCF